MSPSKFSHLLAIINCLPTAPSAISRTLFDGTDLEDFTNPENYYLIRTKRFQYSQVNTKMGHFGQYFENFWQFNRLNEVENRGLIDVNTVKSL